MGALICGACSNDVTLSSPISSGKPIGFSGDIKESITREYSSTNMPTTIGVFAYFTHGIFADNIATATPNYMYNTELSKAADTSTWSYAPILYWPNNTDDKLSFFAYAPYNSTSSLSQVATGYPSFNFALPTDETSETTDLLAASLMDKTYAHGIVKFTLKHALTKVHFIIKNADSDGTSKTISTLSIKSYRTGTINYTANGINWTNTSTADFRTYQFITAPLSLNALYTSEVDAGSTLVIPENTNATISFTYNMTIDGEEKTVTATDTQLPATPAWNPGSVITYTIWLKQEDEATIVATSNSAWSNAGDDETITIE